MQEKRKYSTEALNEMKRSRSGSLSQSNLYGHETSLSEQIKLHQCYLQEIGFRIRSLIDDIGYDELCNYEKGIKLLLSGTQIKMDVHASMFLKSQLNQLRESAGQVLSLIEYLKTSVCIN